jgi:FixJ family two-component response regulator
VQQEQLVIVDDDESMREATISLLRSMGLPAVAFASAEEFLVSGMAPRTSCLVLDVNMPGMCGLTLQDHLASMGRHIPIIFVTAFSDEGVRTRAFESGAVGFIVKPFAEQDLLDGVRSACASTAACIRSRGRSRERTGV